MSGLLAGKRILVTGVLTDDSLAYAVADLAQREGAEIVLTGAGRGLSLTRRVARHLPAPPPDVLELDVTVPDQVDAVASELRARWGALDGVLHSIGFAPPACLGGGFLEAGWDDVKVALEVSAYSLKVLAAGFRPLLQAAGGGSVVGLDFDATVAWPGYDWMGVAKAALESTARYLARDLGAGPHPGQPGGGRADQDHGGQVHPGVLALRGRVGRAGPARLERHRRRTRGPGLRGAAVRLVPRHDRRDGARRRRLPRHGSLRRCPAGSSSSPGAIGASGWPSPTRFAANGDRVAVTHRGEPVEGFCSVRCDVTSSDEVDAAFTAVEEQLGPVEILVSNAGVNADQLLLSMKEDAWARVIDANLDRRLPGEPAGHFQDDPGPLGADHPDLVGRGADRLARPDQLRRLQGRADRLRPLPGPRDRRAGRHRQRGGPRVRHHRHDRGPARSPAGRDRRAGPAPADGQPRGGGRGGDLAGVGAAGYVTGAVIPVDGGLGMGH